MVCIEVGSEAFGGQSLNVSVRDKNLDVLIVYDSTKFWKLMSRR